MPTDPIARTQALDAVKAEEDQAQRRVEAQRQIALDARQARDAPQEQLVVLEHGARQKLAALYHRVELRVLGYRLALSLPLLGVAARLRQ